MNDDTYKPSPALDYQEFMRNAHEWAEANGYALLPIEYTIMPNAVLYPRDHVWPALSDTERLTSLRDKLDILDAQRDEVEDAIDALERKLLGS